MKHVDIEELVGSNPVTPETEPVPVTEPAPAPTAPAAPEPEPPAAMTRMEKLLRWAQLVRQHDDHLGLYSNLECKSDHQLSMMMIYDHGTTALTLAVKDPEFQAQGLASPSSVKEVLNFFELSLQEAHAFSCDCGGDISNEHQAERIERLT
jgi:hypothetical protein